MNRLLRSTEDARWKPGGSNQLQRETVGLIADKIGSFAAPVVKSLPHKGSAKRVPPKGFRQKSLWHYGGFARFLPTAPPPSQISCLASFAAFPLPSVLQHSGGIATY